MREKLRAPVSMEDFARRYALLSAPCLGGSSEPPEQPLAFLLSLRMSEGASLSEVRVLSHSGGS